MVKNVGSSDRIVRIILGLLLVFYSFSNTWAILPLLIGVVLLITAFVNFCPIYRLIGFSTNK